MKFALDLAGAAALDAAFLTGRVIGSFLAGAETALERGKRRRGIVPIEIPDSGPYYVDLDRV